MKIGILTYHRVINIGAILQAYCVCEFYKSLGHDVELIDLRNRRTEMTELRKLINVKKLRLNIDQINNYKSIRSFLKKNFLLSEIRYSGSTNRFAAFLAQKKYDVISVGSDTVWELRDPGYSDLTVNEYFLPFYTGKKISFSASMDPVNKALPIYKNLMQKRADVLKDFAFVNVRDNPTKTAFEEFNVSSNITSDPTIVMKDHKIFNVIQHSNYCSCIGLQIQEIDIRKRIIEIYKDTVISVYSSSLLPDEQSFRSDLSVEDYLINLTKLKILVTDRFHGTLLTLLTTKCQIPVIAYEDPTKWHKGASKIRDLFVSLGLENFLATDKSTLLKLLNKCISGELIWPATEVTAKLSILSAKSKITLSNQLKRLS